MSAIDLLPAAAADLGDRDPALPALSLVLADAPLREWLAERGHHLVRRTYLRYKPGTSCVVGLMLASGPAWLSTVSEASWVKQQKVVQRARPEDILVHDETARVLLARLRADRQLPAVHHLDRTVRHLVDRGVLPPGADSRSLHTLVHKPHRRWVGRFDAADGPTILLRAYEPGRLQRALAGLAVAPADQPLLRTPRIRGTAASMLLLALEFLPGTPLQQLITQDAVDAEDLARVGAALATLHEQPIEGVAEANPAATAPTTELVAHLLPEQGQRVRELERVIAGRGTSPARTRCHGDFSADQVVLPTEAPGAPVGLIDWDRAGVADPASDLAQAWAFGLDGHHRTALLEGYSSIRDLPQFGAQVARAHLLRAADPFRTAEPDWPDQIVEQLRRAEDALTWTGWTG